MFLSVFFLPAVWATCDKNPALFITAPKRMEALRGSCLHIPCSFRVKPGEDFDSRRTTFGVWIKSRPSLNNVIFHSSWYFNIFPMKMTGDLRQKNCTTLFTDLKLYHTNIYFFRIENWHFKATASCDPLLITVKDSAWSPSIKMSADGLKENQSVTISCSAPAPCPHSPPQLTWNLQADSQSHTQENTDGTFTTKLQQTITLSHTHDGYNISCSASYPVNGRQNRIAGTHQTLSVSYAPKDTSASISPSGLLSAGLWVNLTCSSRAKPPISSFTWFKNTRDGHEKVHEGHVYSFSVTERGDYYCVSVNDVGGQRSSWLHVDVPDVFPHTAAVVAVTLVVVALVCLAVFVWASATNLTSSSRFKKHQGQQQTQSQTAAQLPLQTAAAAGTEEKIHYGEISVSKQRPAPSSVSVQDSGQQQDTVYAQVKVQQPANSCTQSAEADQLYAEVK